MRFELVVQGAIDRQQLGRVTVGRARLDIGRDEARHSHDGRIAMNHPVIFAVAVLFDVERRVSLLEGPSTPVGWGREVRRRQEGERVN